MNLTANPTLTLTVASLKMYFRDRQALFWSLLLPLMFMIIFGLMNFGSLGRVDLGVVDLADNSVSQGVLSALEEIEALAVSHESDRESARAAVEQGDRDLVLVIPAGFGPSDERWKCCSTRPGPESPRSGSPCCGRCSTSCPSA